jgi:hypothetical protein
MEFGKGSPHLLAHSDLVKFLLGKAVYSSFIHHKIQRQGFRSRIIFSREGREL